MSGDAGATIGPSKEEPTGFKEFLNRLENLCLQSRKEGPRKVSKGFNDFLARLEALCLESQEEMGRTPE